MLESCRNKVNNFRMSDSTMKFTCSVNYLLNKNPAYSGWLKKLQDKKFSKSYKRKYAIIHEAILYFFDDDESSSTNDFIYLQRFKVEETPRSDATSKWGFSLTGSRTPGKERETLNITVGCERELKDWLFHLGSWRLSPHEDKIIPHEDKIVPSEDKIGKLYEADEADPPDRYVKSVAKKPPPIPSAKPLKLPKLPPKPRWNDYEVSSTEGHLPTKQMECIDINEPDPLDNIYAEADQGGGHDDFNDFLPDSVYQWQFDRSSANALLTDLGTPGVYLIRKGRDETDVLSAFLLGETRHYKIFCENSLLFLRSDHPKFIQLIHLIKYYYCHDLPTCAARLESPYGK